MSTFCQSHSKCEVKTNLNLKAPNQQIWKTFEYLPTRWFLSLIKSEKQILKLFLLGLLGLGFQSASNHFSTLAGQRYNSLMINGGG